MSPEVALLFNVLACNGRMTPWSVHRCIYIGEVISCKLSANVLRLNAETYVACSSRRFWPFDYINHLNCNRIFTIYVPEFFISVTFGDLQQSQNS